MLVLCVGILIVASSKIMLSHGTFVSRNNLKIVWDSPKATVDWTYTNHALNHRSVIDHFIVSDKMYECVTNSCVLYDATNPSNHNVV